MALGTKRGLLGKRNIKTGKDYTGKWTYRVVRNGRIICKCREQGHAERFIQGWNEAALKRGEG